MYLRHIDIEIASVSKKKEWFRGNQAQSTPTAMLSKNQKGKSNRAQQHHRLSLSLSQLITPSVKRLQRLVAHDHAAVRLGRDVGGGLAQRGAHRRLLVLGECPGIIVEVLVDDAAVFELVSKHPNNLKFTGFFLPHALLAMVAHGLRAVVPERVAVLHHHQEDVRRLPLLRREVEACEHSLAAGEGLAGLVEG